MCKNPTQLCVFENLQQLLVGFFNQGMLSVEILSLWA